MATTSISYDRPNKAALDRTWRNLEAADEFLIGLKHEAEHEAVVAWFDGLHKRAELTTHPRGRIDISSPQTIQVGSGINWDCVAVAETGGDFRMHGSSYSSAYGIMNQAVRENSTPDVAARVLAGTASKDEQLGIAMRIAARFGFRAWAPRTVERCS